MRRLSDAGMMRHFPSIFACATPPITSTRANR